MLKKKTIILVIAGFLFYLLPATAPAEDCYDMRDKADQTFDAAAMHHNRKIMPRL